MTAQQITESIQSDIIIKDLYAKLHRLHLSAMPVLVIRDGEKYVSYSDKFKILEATIHEAIEHRQEQISNYYKPIWDKLNK